MKKKATKKDEQFQTWWFEKGGEDIAIEKYGHLITKAMQKKQPSYPNDENSFTEAVWELAKKDNLHLRTTYVITNIEYDTEGHKPKLPKRMTIAVPAHVKGYEEIETFISDTISNRTGYCHKGFATTPKIPED